MKNHNQELFETIKKFKKIFKREYKFLPVPKEEDIILFENKFKVKLPNEYRWFLLNIANGIISKKDWNFDKLDKIDFKNYWHNEEYNPSVNFKLNKKVIFHNPEDFDDYPYETYVCDDTKSDEEFDFLYNGYNTGVIHLCGYGCGTGTMIVVNGEEYGNIWTDDISSNNEVYPEYDVESNKNRLNFIEWFIICLNHEIKMHYLILESEKREIELKKESGEWDISDELLYSLKTLWNKIIN